MIKIVLIGKTGVGKTSLIRRFVKNNFKKNFTPTIGADFSKKKVLLTNPKTQERDTLKLLFWDTAGQEKFKCLTPSFFYGTDICVFVFDLTSKDSFLSLDYWMRDFLELSDLEKKNLTGDYPFLILGNKSDQKEAIVIKKEEVESWMYKHKNLGKFIYLDVSAKTGSNVAHAFKEILQNWMETKSSQEKLDLNKRMENLISLKKAKYKKEHQKNQCCK